MGDDLGFICDDRDTTPEFFEWIWSMTEEEFEEYLKEVRKQDQQNAK